MCQLKKPRANEITEPLAFTVCKLELPGKGIVLQSCSRRTRFDRGQLWAKRKESDVLRPKQKQTKEELPQRVFKEAHVLAVVNKGENEKKENRSKTRNKCRGVVSTRHSFLTMNNGTMRNNP